jgi:oxidase EvaA
MSLQENIQLPLFRSFITDENPFNSTKDVLDWIKEQNKVVNVSVEKVKFSELENWNYNKNNGNIVHSSGKFFSIDGIRVSTNWGEINEWEQVIINQPEIGILGIIAKEFNGILYFLVQAKIEPGNLNKVQLSPTLQATKSNYTQVHKGYQPLYLEYFRDLEKHRIILDQLQSEQGARFLSKRNRNIIIEVDEDIRTNENFRWLTLRQIKELLKNDNLVNMDTRTVISGLTIPKIFKPEYLNQLSKFYESAHSKDYSLYKFDDIIHWITNLKSQYDLFVKKIKIEDVKNWVYTDLEIHHTERKFFSVIGAKIEIGNREVTRWFQPLFQPAQQGLIAFIVKPINGVLHLLVQAKLECGNFDIIELAPTVQCLTGNYRETPSGSLPYLEYILNAKKNQIVFDAMLSEEGGRFYHEENRNLVILADDNFSVETPDNFMWMTISQLLTFLKFNNYLNIQARSLLSVINYSND